MGDKTAIEWSDATWNPLVGCSRVSPGCDHCYAIGVVHRGMSPQHVGLTAKAGREIPTDWTGEVREVPHLLDQPLRWKRPRRIFVNSLSDLFHPDVSEDFICKVFTTMRAAPQHTFQILTKRPQRMAEVVGRIAWVNDPEQRGYTAYMFDGTAAENQASCGGPYVLPNVWLGTSIESDRYAFRADHLRATPAAVRWISAEPLLGPLPSLDLAGIDWVVAGGESGPGARPMHPDWMRDLRDRCLSRFEPCEIPDVPRPHSVAVPGGGRACSCEYRSPVAFLVKQWGNWAPKANGHDSLVQGSSFNGSMPRRTRPTVLLGRDGNLHDRNELTSFRLPPDWAEMVNVGKKAAGRELDGRTWDEYPT